MTHTAALIFIEPSYLRSVETALSLEAVSAITNLLRKMSLMQPDEEVLLRLEDQTNDLSSQNWRLPRFNKASMLAVGLLLCMASTATARLAGFTGKIEAVALWDEFFDFGSPALDRYRRQISHQENSKSLVSWQDVMCRALKDDRGRIVRAVARNYPHSLHATCSGYNSPLEYAVHQQQSMVEILLRAGAVVSDKVMVEAACSTRLQNSQDSFGNQDKSLLMMLLRVGNGNPNSQYNGQSPINCAAQNCDSSEVQTLMQAGAYINTKDQQGFTPLLNALQGGCDSLATEFIENDANIQVQTNTGENALQVACQKCMSDAANMLLEKGIPVDQQDNQGRTALDSAAQHGCVSIASALLKNPFTNINEVDNDGQTALFVALESQGPESLVTMFLDKGADVNHQDNNGQTPLMIAAKAGKNCQVLLQHGANVATEDQAGNTALWYAASVGSTTSATSLLEAGSYLSNKPGAGGKTPFAIACWNTHPEVANVLLEHGADPNIKDVHGQEPLSLATQFTMHFNPGQAPVNTPQAVGTVDQWTARQQRLLGLLKVLVDAKVNLNIYDFEGFTPVLNMLRFQKNRWGVPAQAEAFSQAVQANADFLLEHGADPNMASQEGHITPLAFCAYNGFPTTAGVLLQRGANRYAQNAWGKTPIQLCGGGAGQLQVAQMLR